MNDLSSLLASYCSDYGLSLTADQQALCLKHLNLVIEKNKVMNLTRIVDPSEAVALHILDSLLLLPYLDCAPKGAFLDMGTGAGFPGIPLAIASGRPAFMIDSVGKKVDAVNEFICKLGLSGCEAIHDRLEVAAVNRRASFAAVTARALAPLPVLIEYATPFLVQDGLFIVTKGDPEDSELDSGSKAARICCLSLIDSKACELPLSLGHRQLYIYKKVSEPSVSLPRANGLARKNPLA